MKWDTLHRGDIIIHESVIKFGVVCAYLVLDLGFEHVTLHRLDPAIMLPTFTVHRDVIAIKQYHQLDDLKGY